MASELEPPTPPEDQNPRLTKEGKPVVFKVAKSETCPASGWGVSSATTRPNGDDTERCPQGGHKVKTTPVADRPGAVRIADHRRPR